MIGWIIIIFIVFVCLYEGYKTINTLHHADEEQEEEIYYTADQVGGLMVEVTTSTINTTIQWISSDAVVIVDSTTGEKIANAEIRIENMESLLSLLNETLGPYGITYKIKEK